MYIYHESVTQVVGVVYGGSQATAFHQHNPIQWNLGVRHIGASYLSVAEARFHFTTYLSISNVMGVIIYGVIYYQLHMLDIDSSTNKTLNMLPSSRSTHYCTFSSFGCECLFLHGDLSSDFSYSCPSGAGGPSIVQSIDFLYLGG